MCEHARPDVQPAVAFLTTCASQPDEDDWKKLRRMIDHLKGTPNQILTASADGAWVPKWHVDVSHAVHKDMRSHTGGCMTPGKGSAHAASLKQKIIARSSTEGESVGADDMMGPISWTNCFSEEQGHLQRSLGRVSGDF